VPEATVVALLIVFLAVGVLTRRWSAIALPLLAWPIYFAGLDRGWWFYGTGDGWHLGAVLITATSVASTALGVLLARRTTRRFFAKPS